VERANERHRLLGLRVRLKEKVRAVDSESNAQAEGSGTPLMKTLSREIRAFNMSTRPTCAKLESSVKVWNWLVAVKKFVTGAAIPG